MAVLIHAFPFVTESGFDRNVAAAGLSIDGYGNLVSKVAWGWGLGSSVHACWCQSPSGFPLQG